MISGMSKPVPALAMTDAQREVLESLARSQSAAHREVVRAKALLMAADRPPAPPPVRKAFRTIDIHITETIDRARLLPKAA